MRRDTTGSTCHATVCQQYTDHNDLRRCSHATATVVVGDAVDPRPSDTRTQCVRSRPTRYAGDTYGVTCMQHSENYLHIRQPIVCPKGMYDADLDGSTPPDLEIANYGFTDADLDSEVRLGNSLQSGFLANDRGPVKLGEVVQRLRQATHARLHTLIPHLA